MNFTNEQLTRLSDFLQEVKDCQSLSQDWTEDDYCDYINEWIDPTSNFSGYVKTGGERPARPGHG